MSPDAKRKSASQRKRPAGATSKSPGSSKPFLRFYFSPDLRKKTLSVLGSLEKAQDPTAYRAALADVVVQLSNSGMDAYFMRPLEVAKAGFIVQQSANLGLTGVKQMMGTVIRNIIGRMDRPQLLSVCGSIRQFMV